MKKLLLAAALAGALVATGCAASSTQSSTATSSGQAGSSETSSLAASAEDGTYAIEAAIPAGQAGEWRTDDPATLENNVVKLVSSAVEGDAFVAQYEPVNDGTTSVNLKHYNGPACDMFYTYTLTVENGQISQKGEAVLTQAPAADALNPFLAGNWAEDETQFTVLDLENNDEGGWSAQAVSPVSHGAYVYKMTLYYDCELQKLVYDDGAVYDAPITDSADETDLGDPNATGKQGTMEITSTDDGNVALFWNAEANGGDHDITFVRTDGDAEYADFEKALNSSIANAATDAEEASDQDAQSDATERAESSDSSIDEGQNPIMNFVGPYACGRASMMVEPSGANEANITITWGSSAAEAAEWSITGTFDPDTFTVNYSDAVKTYLVFQEDGSIKTQEVEYSDGSGRIIFHDDNMLSCTWENDNEPENGAMDFTWSA